MYDAATRPEHFLREYAEEFATVEIDATFYGTPQSQRVLRWASQVPADFTFAVKLPREVTHERRLISAKPLVDEFVGAVEHFGAQLEAILIQLAPDFTPADVETLETFVRELPAGPRWAVELRDADWFHGTAHARLRDALGTHGIALAITDGPFVARETMLHELRHPTASHAYLRWIGRRGSAGRFDRVFADRSAELAEWVAAIQAAAPQIARLAGYASNEYAGHAPATVRDLYAALGLVHRRPARIEQTSLFEPEG